MLSVLRVMARRAICLGTGTYGPWLQDFCHIATGRLAKETKRSTSFYYNYLLDEYLDDMEDIFLAEETVKKIRAGKEKTYSLSDVKAELGL